jgi:mercuric ion transport protein
MEQQPNSDSGRRHLLAAGGLVGALLASSCCIVPLVLLTLGVSGAWIGNLTGLAPYQGYFTAATLVFLVSGFWFVYRKPGDTCELGTYCASPQSDRLIKSVLWGSTLLIGIALADDWWAPLIT